MSAPAVMCPLKFLYHGPIFSTPSPSSTRRMLATRSRGLKLGMEVDHPVPMPSDPFTSSSGSMGR